MPTAIKYTGRQTVVAEKMQLLLSIEKRWEVIIKVMYLCPGHPSLAEVRYDGCAILERPPGSFVIL